MASEEQRKKFVEALKRVGGSAGNMKLREELGWAESTYDRVRDALLADGLVAKGRGRGGSVSLVAVGSGGQRPQTPPPPAPPAKPSAPRGRKAAKPANGNGNGAPLGFEDQLFKAADKLRGNMEPSDYKHVALGLIFLKHISDSFEAKHAALFAEESGLSDEEVAFYDALAENQSAVDVLGDASLRLIAHELLQSLKSNITVDWAHRESARARLRVLVKRILRKYGYPPDLQDSAVQTVLQQAEALSAQWAA